MPPMNVPHWTVFGRPVKPVAFALMLTMLTISWAAWSDAGLLGAAVGADFLGIAAGSVGLLLFTAWWRRSQRLAEWGLLMAFAIWFFRTFLVVMLNWGNAPTDGWFLSLSWVLVAGGSYWLEKADPHRIGWADPKRAV